MNDVDQYIAEFSGDTKKRLELIRKTVFKNAPNATERICMNMPTYDLNGTWFFHFASFKNHIGIYPQPSGIEVFKKRLTEYKTSKGSISFPHSKPLPMDLIEEIVIYRYAESNSDI